MQLVGRRSARHRAAAAIVSVLGVFAISGSASQATTAASYECDGPSPIYLDTSYTFEERAADLVSWMSLGQKVPQLHTNSAPAIPSLGVQQYWYWNEGQHGVNTLSADTNPGSAAGGVHATSFPTNFAADDDLGPGADVSGDDRDLRRGPRVPRPVAVGQGQNNLGPSPSDYGDLTFWAPTVNMDRDPRWGRTDEAFGEDPVPGRPDGRSVRRGLPGRDAVRHAA